MSDESNQPIMPRDDFYNGTSSKDPTETSDDTTSKLPPTGVDYDFCDLDMAPLLERLNKLTERQAGIVNAAWGARGFPPLDQFTWPHATALAEVIIAAESDAAIAPPNTAVAHVDWKMAVASAMAELDIRIRHMCMTRFSNYGTTQYASGLVTQGECETMLWCIANIPESWLPEATDITETAKPFAEVAAEQEQEQEQEDKLEAQKQKQDAAKLTLSTEHDPPAEYDSPVPLGSWGVIKDWIHEGSYTRNLTEVEVAEYLAERAHRALIAEVRRRGDKQRKVVVTSTQKLIPDGWLPPYMRVPAPDEGSPAIATIAEMTRLDGDDALHIIITNEGVRYWVEQADE